MSFINQEAHVREEDLQAYVDGLLEVNLRASVEAYLALHPEEAERVTAYRAQNVALHQAYDFMTKAPLPASMERMAEKLSGANRAGWLRRGARYMSAAAVVLAAVSTGWLAHDHLADLKWPQLQWQRDPLSTFTQRAIEAHALLTGAQSPPLVEKGTAAGNALVGWLSQRASAKSRSAPDLKDFGLSLAGGRIFFIRDQLVVQLIYQDKQSRLSLYVGASPKDNRRTTFTFAQQGGLSTFYWRQAKLEFSLVGQMQRGRLLEVAKFVQTQLGTPTGDTDTVPGGGVHPVSSGDTGAAAPNPVSTPVVGAPNAALPAQPVKTPDAVPAPDKQSANPAPGDSKKGVVNASASGRI